MNEFDILYKCECGEKYLVEFSEDEQVKIFTCDECGLKVKLKCHIDTYLTIEYI